MKRLVCIATIATLLMSPLALFAAPSTDAPSASGLWRIDGDVMGAPVKMTCTLADTDHKLTGVCSGAADGFTPHKIDGSVKTQKLQFHFQSDFGGRCDYIDCKRHP